MDTDFPVIPESRFKNVHNAHHMLKSCTCHVLPALTETMDAVFVEVLGNVTETHVFNDAVAAVRMLLSTYKYFSRLLQIKDSPDTIFFKLLVQVVLLYKSFRRPLHCQNLVSYPVRVKTFDRVRELFVSLIVFMLALGASTKLT